MGLKMMNVKVNNIVLLEMICIGLCSSRDIGNNVKSDGEEGMLCSINSRHCEDNDLCNEKCLNASYLRDGKCKYKTCCRI